MTADDDWTWVERLQRFGIHPGLARTRSLFAALGDPQGAFEVALVAGTNGKGSTVALLDAMLRADDLRPARAPRSAGAAAHGPVGRFVSPHLSRFGERFTVDGRPLPDAALGAALREVRPHAERLGATFFEVLVAVAALAFARAGVGRAVFEVGMGGRLDATNASEPTLSVITQIALDHEAVLGRDVATIAGEKAGVLRAGRPAVTSAEGVALGVVRARAAEIGAALEVVDEMGAELRDVGWAGVEVRGLGQTAIRAPLLGAHQARNLAAAALAARAWGVPWDAVVAGAGAVEWPGRLERVEAHGCRWLLDGAHNPAGAVALAGALDRLDARARVAVLGVTDDRLGGDLPAALSRLAPVLVATRATRSPRAATAVQLAERLRALGAERVRALGAERVRALAGAGVVAVDDVGEALEAAAALALASADAEPVAAASGAPAAPDPPTVVVAGSLYLVGEARALLLGQAPEAFERWQ